VSNSNKVNQSNSSAYSQYNAKFWRAPIGQNRSRDVIASLLSRRLLAYSARLWQFPLKIKHCTKKTIESLTVSGPTCMCETFPWKFDPQTERIARAVQKADNSFGMDTLSRSNGWRFFFNG